MSLYRMNNRHVFKVIQGLLLKHYLCRPHLTHLFFNQRSVISPERKKSSPQGYGKNLTSTFTAHTPAEHAPLHLSDSEAHQWLIGSHRSVNMKHSILNLAVLTLFQSVNTESLLGSSFLLFLVSDYPQCDSTAPSVVADEHSVACVWIPVRTCVTSWGQGEMDGGY